MIGIKQTLLIASSVLLVLSVSGPANAATPPQQGRRVAKGMELTMSMSTKGSGKGGKGGKGSDDIPDIAPMSMPGSSKGGKGGKGKGGSKSDSSMDSSKDSSKDSSMDSSKSSKSSKKGEDGAKKSKKDKKSKKGGEGGMPAAPTAPTPPSAPSPPSEPTPTTPSPTSANSIPIRATPYALFYTISNERIPSEEEYAALADVTRVYLEGFMIDEFSQTSLTNLDDFITFMIRNSFTFGSPVQADYRSTGLFNPSSIFLPTVRELNELITTAFTTDNLGVYLGRVKALPSSNVFSSTTAITKGLPDVPTPRGESSSAFGTAGVAAAAAGIVVLAAGLILLRRRKTEDDEFDEKYGKTPKGDATVAGETCNMSLDGSSVVPWTKGSTRYTMDDDDDSDGALDEDEFEDEPLSEEQEPRHSPSQSPITQSS